MFQQNKTQLTLAPSAQLTFGDIHAKDLTCDKANDLSFGDFGIMRRKTNTSLADCTDSTPQNKGKTDSLDLSWSDDSSNCDEKEIDVRDALFAKIVDREMDDRRAMKNKRKCQLEESTRFIDFCMQKSQHCAKETRQQCLTPARLHQLPFTHHHTQNHKAFFDIKMASNSVDSASQGQTALC